MEPSWKLALNDVVAHVRNSEARVEYPLRRLQGTLGPVRREDLLTALERFVRKGDLVPFYRVRSKVTGAGIDEEYASILDIPDKIFDTTSYRYQVVDPSDIELIYRGPAKR